MSDKPFYCNADDVSAILDGRKTMARRVVRPRFKVGDVLLVREPWEQAPDGSYLYKTDPIFDGADVSWDWRPSTTMPREAARVFLEVTHVRVERLQDISEEDAKAEGVIGLCVATAEICKNTPHEVYCNKTCPHYGESHIAGFRYFWDKLNAKRGYGWDKNPLVWVIEFRRIER